MAAPGETGEANQKSHSHHKETLAQALIELIKVRTIMGLSIVWVMSYLAVIEAIKPETFMTVASAAATYYFTRHER